LTIDLFTWWVISISWSIAFLIGAGFYLYTSSKARRKEKIKVRSQRRLTEPRVYTALAVISIIGAFAQTMWWLFPCCVFFLLALLAAVQLHLDQNREISFKVEALGVSKNFIFVWVLLGLLIFYIFSVKLGTGKFSEFVFALGNLIVEILLVFYLFKNRDKTRRPR
jgi:magnesium-transporting ATPase (P-type)